MVGGTGAPLRGRHKELAAIDARLDEVRSGVGSVIVVEGRAGLGKSRLLDACASLAVERSFRVGKGAAEPVAAPSLWARSTARFSRVRGPSPHRTR